MILKPGEQRNLTVTVDPVEGLATVTKTVTVETDENKNPIHQITATVHFVEQSYSIKAASNPVQ